MKKAILLASVSVVALNANAVDHSKMGHDMSAMGHKGHSGPKPFHIMNDHVMAQGTGMVAYTYKRMEMDHLKRGSDDATEASVLADYMMTPQEMTMEMHMVSGMYGLTDQLTGMVMLPFVEKNMRMRHRNGNIVHNTTKGMGDVKLGGTYKLTDNLVAGLNLSLPTGSINKTNNAGVRLGYGMQLGSGTYDLTPSVTYTGKTEMFNYGAQAKATLRLHDNPHDYNLGNEYGLSAWAGKQLTDKLDATVGIDAMFKDGIDGQDPTRNASMMSTQDTNNYGGTRVNLNAGVGYKIDNSRLSLQVEAPVYEDLDGVQLSQTYAAMLRWRFAF